jgi:hypothetical protein
VREASYFIGKGNNATLNDTGQADQPLRLSVAIVCEQALLSDEVELVVSTVGDKQHEFCDWQWLAEQSALLERLAGEPFEPLKLAKMLRREHSIGRTRLVIDQLELRRRARDKFAAADSMLFTRKGYEQASDESIARYKARRFATYAATVDLCCGIGGDTLGLAANTDCAGVDFSEIALLCANFNLESYGLKARFVVSQAEAFAITDLAAWHVDPDRRSLGRRTVQLSQMSPSESVISRWVSGNPNGAIKLAPATPLDDWPHDCEREWIGRRGECRQQVAWHGSLTTSAGLRRATLLDDDSEVRQTLVGIPAPPRFSPQVADFVYDVDSTVLAAGLVGPLASQHGLHAWSNCEGYLTGPAANDAALVRFAVDEVLPLRAQAVSDWLRQRGIGQLEIKHRIPQFDIAKFRRQLRLRGDNHGVVMLASQGSRKIAVMAHRHE